VTTILGRNAPPQFVLELHQFLLSCKQRIPDDLNKLIYAIQRHASTQDDEDRGPRRMKEEKTGEY